MKKIQHETHWSHQENGKSDHTSTTKNTKTKRRHANPPARLAFRHREKTAKQNKKRGQSPNKTPRTKTQDLPSDTGGMSHRVIKNMHYEPIKIFIHGPANSVKQCISKLPLKKEANGDITRENCTQRKHSLRFLSHAFPSIRHRITKRQNL